MAISEELGTVSSIDEVVAAHPTYINVAVHYIRPRHVNFIRDAFQPVILELCNADDVDLESDPSTVCALARGLLTLLNRNIDTSGVSRGGGNPIQQTQHCPERFDFQRSS